MTDLTKALALRTGQRLHRNKAVLHQLKVVEPYFTDLKNGIKQFELRQYTAQDDKPARDFQAGDLLELFSVDDPRKTSIFKRVVYVLKDTDICCGGKLAPGYCILGLRDVTVKELFDENLS